MADSSTTKRRTRSATKRQTPATETDSVENALLGPPPSPTPNNPPKRVRGGSSTRLSPIPEKNARGRKGRRGRGVPKASPILEQLLQDHPNLRVLDGQDLSTVALERLSASKDLVELVEELGRDETIPSLAMCALLESETRTSAAVEARLNQSLSGDALREVIWSKDEQEHWHNPNFPLERVTIPPMPSFPSPSQRNRFETATDATVDGASKHDDEDRTPSEVDQAVSGDGSGDRTQESEVEKSAKFDGDENKREREAKVGAAEGSDGKAQVQGSVEPDTKGKGKGMDSSALAAQMVCHCVMH
jgi:hypothetical protein